MADEELLYRFVVSPSDLDKGKLTFSAVRRVSMNGLSLFREGASAGDVENLVTDRLTILKGSTRRTVEGLIEIRCGDIRTIAADGDRKFCVYDETVPRKNPELPRVGTHVSLYQRTPKPETPDRKKLIHDAS